MIYNIWQWAKRDNEAFDIEHALTVCLNDESSKSKASKDMHILQVVFVECSF